MVYYARKIGYFVLTLWAAVTLNFIIPRLQPGDPAEIMVRQLTGKGEVDPAQVAAIRTMLGYGDENVLVAYVKYLGQMIRGDFGISFTYFPFPVTDVIWKALPWTLVLVGLTQLLSFVLGTLLGAIAAWRRNSRFDATISVGSTFVGNLQSVWIGLMILYVFAYQLGWFPASGGYGYTDEEFSLIHAADVISHGFLPALTLMITAPIGFILSMRNTMVQVLGEDYIRLGAAAGLKQRTLALGYAARNALLPVVTSFALSLGVLMGGSILIETVFDYPGMGRLMGEATAARDFPLMQTILLATIVIVLTANFIVDLLYPLIDPRARRAKA
ncbi:ABC transporter permease [Microbacterium sp. T2.11-28]|uniref:ABC transporter permease n=1 Tax=unclassified Microbacterium TaxID=2609290 RepID=UPI0024777B79|nr:ABC transporter permease [Microbacterium sp. T2.11-28]CAI9389279.1 Dipeptide transport system permease protein DppB [Microbacterium sp. T2.11-28]